MASIVFMGTPQFAVPVLQALVAEHDMVAVVTQPDRLAGRGRSRRRASPVKLAAESLGVRVLQPARLRRNEEVCDALREIGADLFVVAAFGQILPPALLALPPHGCIAAHPSLLPRFRGAAPIAAAILRGEQETGVTLILTDAGIDTGPIIAQRRLAIEPADTTETLSDRLSHLAAELLTETLPDWLGGEIQLKQQEDSQATYAPRITGSEGLIDWRCTAIEIDRKVRAFTPWPRAHTSHKGKMLNILKAHPLPSEGVGKAPGTVVANDGEIAVVTGCGLLVLQRVQLAGKKAMDADAFARGQRRFVGSVLA